MAALGTIRKRGVTLVVFCQLYRLNFFWLDINLNILIKIPRILPLPVGIGKVSKNISIGRNENKNTFTNPLPKNLERTKPIKIERPNNITSLTP